MFAVLLAAALTVAGCGSAGNASSDTGSAAESGAKVAAPGRADASVADGSGPAGTRGATTADAPRAPVPTPAGYLVRTAQLSVRTPHVERQMDAARTFAVDAGGYAGDENTSVDARGRTASSVQLRVPPAAYDRVLTELAGLGTLLARKVSVEDVTGQVVDVNSRIRSQQASLVRLRALMDRAQQLSAIVSLESELTTRETDLEALEAQQASLKSRTDLATITLRLTEPPVKRAAPKPAHHDSFGASVGHALGDGWHAFWLTLRGALVVLSVALPFLAVALLGWFGYRRLRRRLPGSVVTPSLRAPEHAEVSAAAPLPHHPPESEREQGGPQGQEPPAGE
jgi:hypothetical protein